MSEQIRIDFYTEIDVYGECHILSPTFWDVQRGREVEEEFLVGRVIERISCENTGEILLTLKEKKEDFYPKRGDGPVATAGFIHDSVEDRVSYRHPEEKGK